MKTCHLLTFLGSVFSVLAHPILNSTTTVFPTRHLGALEKKFVYVSIVTTITTVQCSQDVPAVGTRHIDARQMPAAVARAMVPTVTVTMPLGTLTSTVCASSTPSTTAMTYPPVPTTSSSSTLSRRKWWGHGSTPKGFDRQCWFLFKPLCWMEYKLVASMYQWNEMGKKKGEKHMTFEEFRKMMDNAAAPMGTDTRGIFFKTWHYEPPKDVNNVDGLH
ncbi:hypothetical protein MMC12_006824 [Toensbergia leucococca]|nr:hypothetical protein [Toensbergia leucococca]